jgi:hypothetical protein
MASYEFKEAVDTYIKRYSRKPVVKKSLITDRPNFRKAIKEKKAFVVNTTDEEVIKKLISISNIPLGGDVLLPVCTPLPLMSPAELNLTYALVAVGVEDINPIFLATPSVLNLISKIEPATLLCDGVRKC